MEKQKRWQLFLITAVILLTVYNILPTLFYYAKPLEKPVTKQMALSAGQEALERVNDLKTQSTQWIEAFCRLLNIKNPSIAISEKDPQHIKVSFPSSQDASLFKNYLPKAGSLISFTPAQLSLSEIDDLDDGKTITVLRKIPFYFDQEQKKSLITFTEKFDEDHRPTAFYQKLLNDRLIQIAISVAGVSENAQLAGAALHSQDLGVKDQYLLALCENIESYAAAFGQQSSTLKRVVRSIAQGYFSDKTLTVGELVSSLDGFKDRLRMEKIQLQEKKSQDPTDIQKLEAIAKKEALIAQAQTLIKKEQSSYLSPMTYEAALSHVESTPELQTQTLTVGDNNPLISKIVLDLSTETVLFQLHSDILKTKSEAVDQILYNEIARISRESGEEIKPLKGSFQIALSSLEDSQSLLALDMGMLASKQSNMVKEIIESSWTPSHQDLRRDVFPVWDYQTYEKLPSHEKKLGLVIYAPSTLHEAPKSGFKSGSIYVIAKGVNQILRKYEGNTKSEQASLFIEEFQQLQKLLRSYGYYGYPGTTYPLNTQFSKDFIFECEDFYEMSLSATREDFKVFGTKRFATLEFNNIKQRIHALNSIENNIHEDLLKWRDDYQTAQVNPNLHAKFDVPKPTQSPLWSNLALSAKKYFRGDDRKILHWGLDLSGGKTVQIELRDQNQKKVTSPADITQGINELYRRVNKMGVSEVSIRQEGNNITLDFPGAQGLSAAELVKASSMYFHIVNEKFSSFSDLGSSVNRFLQDVWNEAVVTGKKDADSINYIAWKHLYGESVNPAAAQPRSEAAKELFKQGLRLPIAGETETSSLFNNQLSKIAVMRGNSLSDWQGQSHPLMIVFNNYALEGSSLTNVHSSYNPTKGNFLSFEVKSSQVSRSGEKTDPRSTLYAWTSAYSKEKVVGSSEEKYSQGRGWRMAVILNGSVISSPSLDSAIKDSAMITGNFTQREASKLEADLKAGSLTFSPVILSEKNVSPELGAKERVQGIVATIIALALVVVAMIAYYRFAGVVASVALVINLLIMWATLQNIQATMTLAGIAGIILSIGMSVDANVLIFERVKEEYKLTQRIAAALNAGYKKAFSAIIDSNLTTIIAALILLNFDSGPIKGFAVTIIIGTASSMLTALFMTRWFFSKWVQNPANKELNMASWIKPTQFNFLKYGKLAVILSVVITLMGAYSATMSRRSLMGMDFTGGFSLTMQLNPDSVGNYRERVEKALVEAHLTSKEFQVRELSPSSHVRVFLSKTLNDQGKAFAGMPAETGFDVSYSYENNPRILWLIGALSSQGLSVESSSKPQLASEWTSISGQISDTMRDNAFYGLALALVCILLYITIRFEFKYAVAATIGLIHDVIITVATICILHLLGVNVQIELNTIAALMAIIGYSLNDTIIIFDRIREDLKQGKRSSFKEIATSALNVTLSRTLMTSGTTLLVLLALVCLGGSTIFGFALVMTIGILYGTLSSLFVAAPLLYFLEKRESKQHHFTVEIL